MQESTLSTEEPTSYFDISPLPGIKNVTFPETITTGENVPRESSETFEVSSGTVDDQETVAVDETKGEEQKLSEEQRKQDSMYHSDYRFGLRLRVHYRINEEAVRCLLLVR